MASGTMKDFRVEMDMQEEYHVLQAMRYHQWASLSKVKEDEFFQELEANNKRKGTDFWINKGALRTFVDKAKEVMGVGMECSPIEATAHDTEPSDLQSRAPINHNNAAPLQRQNVRNSVSGSQSSASQSLGSKEESGNSDTGSRKLKYIKNAANYSPTVWLDKLFTQVSKRTYKGTTNPAGIANKTPGDFFYKVGGTRVIEALKPGDDNQWKGRWKCLVPGCEMHGIWRTNNNLGSNQNCITHGCSDAHTKALEMVKRNEARSNTGQEAEARQVRQNVDMC